MPENFNLLPILDRGFIKDKPEYERAVKTERRLRLDSTRSSGVKILHIKLKDIIADYEDRTWDDGAGISDELLYHEKLANRVAIDNHEGH